MYINTYIIVNQGTPGIRNADNSWLTGLKTSCFNEKIQVSCFPAWHTPIRLLVFSQTFIFTRNLTILFRQNIISLNNNTKL